MNRINTLFQQKKEHILSLFFTAGYPNLDDTRSIVTACYKAGVDMLEIGIPYSDPIADGPTIQDSSQKALDNGMSLKHLFSQLQGIRNEIPDMPILLMGYLNPVMQYGVKAFCKSCQEVGIDGLILPDLPIYEYETEYKDLFEKHGLLNTFLITPQTSVDRIRKIDEISSGFIYMVSSSSTTGKVQDIKKEQLAYFQRITHMNLVNPCVIGFGISDAKSFATACQYAQGAIVGSAFIKMLSQSHDVEKDISSFVSELT